MGDSGLSYEPGDDSFEASIEDVLKVVPKVCVEFQNVATKANSATLKCFKRHGTTCWMCGAEASHFVIARQEDQTMFVPLLVGPGYSGREVQFTKDHIIPLSWGGNDSMKNLRTMCQPCNQVLGRIHNQLFFAMEQITKKHDVFHARREIVRVFAPDVMALVNRIDRFAEMLGKGRWNHVLTKL